MVTAVRSGINTLPIRRLKERAMRAASGFHDEKIRDGAVVALLMRNDIPFLEASIGARVAGAYAVPINWHFTPKEIGYILKDCEARALIVHADLLWEITDVIPRGTHVWVVPTPAHIAAAYDIEGAACVPPASDEPWDEWLELHKPWDKPPALSRGTMFYTSGTTGEPKGVRREAVNEKGRLAYTKILGQVFGLREGARVAITGPLYHSAPNAYALRAVDLDCDVWLVPRFEPQSLLRLIDHEKITHLHMVPTMFIRLLHLPPEMRGRFDVSSIEYAVHGAAPCPPEVKKQMIDWWGPVIHEYYGSTEVSVVTHADSEDALAKPGTAGRVLDGTEVRILDEDGKDLPPGQCGEIYVRQKHLPDFTYNNHPEMREEIGLDGGFVTNADVGYIDEEGYLFLNDRKRDMIISGGVNIYPAEIEAVLVQHPAVRDCAVFGIPHDEYGESVAAAVEFKPEKQATSKELRDFLAKYLAKYKLPRVIKAEAALPREDSGKIFKRKLREPYWKKAGRKI